VTYEKLIERSKEWFESQGIAYRVRQEGMPGAYFPSLDRVVFNETYFEGKEAYSALVHIHELIHAMFHKEKLISLFPLPSCWSPEYKELLHVVELEAEILSFAVLDMFGLNDSQAIGCSLHDRISLFAKFVADERKLVQEMEAELQHCLERLLIEVYW
jgi:hypothetical protein